MVLLEDPQGLHVLPHLVDDMQGADLAEMPGEDRGNWALPYT